MYLYYLKYMHFESIVSKDLEGRLGGKTTFGSQPPEGRKRKCVFPGTRASTTYRAHLDDSAKLLSYRAGECDPMYKNEQVVNLLRRSRQ